MESTRKWLAGAIGQDLDALAVELVRMLRAAGVPIGPATGRAVLADLVAWLRGEGSAAAARKALGQRRARVSARLSVNEHLKRDGHLGLGADDHRRAREVDSILDDFFAIGPPVAKNEFQVERTPRPSKTSPSRGETPRSGANGPAGEKK